MSNVSAQLLELKIARVVAKVGLFILRIDSDWSGMVSHV